MTLSIIILVCVALLGLLRVLFFVGMLIEKQSIRSLKRVADDHPKTANPTSTLVMNEAKTLLFTNAGVFSDGDKGWKEGVVSLHISPDSRVLLCIHHTKGVRRYRFLTRAIDGLWIITTNGSSYRDPTGLTDEASMPSKHFRVVHRYHLERLGTLLAQHGGEVVLFTPETAATDLDELMTERADRMIEMGFGKLAAPHPTEGIRRWVFTPKGALKAGSVLSISAMKKSAALMQAKEKEWGF